MRRWMSKLLKVIPLVLVQGRIDIRLFSPAHLLCLYSSGGRRTSALAAQPLRQVRANQMLKRNRGVESRCEVCIFNRCEELIDSRPIRRTLPIGRVVVTKIQPDVGLLSALVASDRGAVLLD